MIDYRMITPRGPKNRRKNNVKKEAPDTSKKKEVAWWRLDSMTLFIIFGIILLNIAFFISPEIMDTLVSGLFHIIDVRRWPWYQFSMILIMGFFVWQWIRLGLQNPEERIDNEHRNKWFLRFSILLSCEMVLLILLKGTKVWFFCHNALVQWLGYGAWSLTAPVVFFMGLALFGLTLYFAKEWIQSLLNG